MKGIIADIKGRYAVVLTQDGLFKRIRALPGMVIGEEIDLDQPSGRKSRKTVMKITSIAAVCLLALGIGAGAYSYVTPYSYIDLDINPSIELTVNIYDRIIEVEALNEDGDRLIQDRNFRHMKLDSGVMLLLNSAVEQGYLRTPARDAGPGSHAASENQSCGSENTYIDEGVSQPSGSVEQSQNTGVEQTGNGTADVTAITDPGDGKAAADSKGCGASNAESAESEQSMKIENAVLLTVSSTDRKKADSLKKSVAAAAAEELEKEKVKSEVLVGQTSLEQREAAKTLGLTPGKLALIEDAIQNMPQAEPDEFKNAPVRDLLELARNKRPEPQDEKSKIGREEEKQDKGKNNSRTGNIEGSGKAENSADKSSGTGKGKAIGPNSGTDIKAGRNSSKVSNNKDTNKSKNSIGTADSASYGRPAVQDKDTGPKPGNTPKDKQEKSNARTDNTGKKDPRGKDSEDISKNDGRSPKDVRETLEKQGDKLKEERKQLREELYKQLQDDKKGKNRQAEKKTEGPGAGKNKGNDIRNRDNSQKDDRAKTGREAGKGR